MTRRKSGQDIHGILLLDKRLGVSSNKALQEVRHLYSANKAGHTGSLDPLATGLLPICFGEATKVSAFLLDQDKRYRTVIKLGLTTTTGDAEGEVIEVKPVPVLSVEYINRCLQAFIGEIQQIPPMYSALKHNGKKLYELARSGCEVERKARAVNIFALNLLTTAEELERAPDCLVLDVACSKGTYIRTLAEDIGNALGCGAVVSELRRLAVGEFRLEDAFTLAQLVEMDKSTLYQKLIDIDKPLQAFNSVQLSEKQAEQVRFGQAVRLPLSSDFESIVAKGSWVRMYCGPAFLGLGEMFLDGRLAPRRVFSSVSFD